MERRNCLPLSCHASRKGASIMLKSSCKGAVAIWKIIHLEVKGNLLEITNPQITPNFNPKYIIFLHNCVFAEEMKLN